MEDKDIFDMNWEQPEVPGAEMKQIQRSIRKRNWKLVSVSVLLAAAILWGAIYVAIPVAESHYWNPGTIEYGDEFASDLELALWAYGRVFCPRVNIADVTYTRTDFASYDLTISHWDSAIGGRVDYALATMTRGKLELPEGFFRTIPANIFERGSYPVYSLEETERKAQRETLESLPEYIDLEVAVSFPNDLDMEQLLAFVQEWEEARVIWVGIRNAPENQQRYPLPGMAPFTGGYVRDCVNDNYPCFDVGYSNITAEDLEQHFVSLLTFLKDQEEAGHGVGYTNGIDYYGDVLSYIEEGGVKTYGCMIVGPASMFLEMLDSGIASQVWIQDAWIDV